MKAGWFVVVGALTGGLLSGGCESGDPFAKMIGRTYESPKMVYKAASVEVNRKAEEALREVLSSNDLAGVVETWPGPLIFCGAFLWTRIAGHPELKDLDLAKMHGGIPVVEEGKIVAVRQLEGRVFQKKEQTLALLRALQSEITGGSQYRIRHLDEREKEIYWAVMPFNSIDEPVFAVESDSYELLVDMLERDGVCFPVWLDDFKNVSIRQKPSGPSPADDASMVLESQGHQSEKRFLLPAALSGRGGVVLGGSLFQ